MIYFEPLQECFEQYLLPPIASMDIQNVFINDKLNNLKIGIDTDDFS